MAWGCQEMAWYQQTTTIAWDNADPDLCHHIAPLGHNELKSIGLLENIDHVIK